MNRKPVLMIAVLALVGSLAAAGAQAREVYWSVGIQAPLHSGVTLGTVFSNAPVYRASPVYYEEPVYRESPVHYEERVYLPAPIIYLPPRVYAPAPAYPVYWEPPMYQQRPSYAPRRVVYAPAWVPPGHAKRHWRHAQPQRGEPVLVDYRR